MQTEYNVNMLIRQFVSLRVSRGTTLLRQREVLQTDGSICLRKGPFIIYILHNSSNRYI